MSSEGAEPCGSAHVVIFRHYTTKNRAALARLWRQTLPGVVFLVAGDPALALAVKADGVHYPQWHLKNGRPLKRLKPHWYVSAAAHDEVSALRARRAGADLILLSPVFPTPHKGTPLGVLGFARLALSVRGQGVALGGLQKHHWRRLRQAGAVGLAGQRLFTPGPEPSRPKSPPPPAQGPAPG